MIFDVIRNKYKYGGLSLDDLIHLVDEKKITKEDFHRITTYNFDVIKEKRGQN